MFKRDPTTGIWRPVRRGLCSILPGLGMQAPGFGPKGSGAEAFSVTYLGTQETTANSASSLWSFGSFGAEATNRTLLALVTLGDQGDPRMTISGTPTIGGINATIVAEVYASLSANRSALILSALVPTGGSGDVSITWNESSGIDRQCTLLRVPGISPTPHDADVAVSTTSGTTVAQTIAVPAGGLAVGVAAWINGSTAGSWTNLSSEPADASSTDGNVRHLVGYQQYGSAQASLTITATAAGAVSHRALAVASFPLA